MTKTNYPRALLSVYLLATVVAASAVFLTLAVKPADAAFPETNGKIVFTRAPYNVGGPTIGEIFTMNPDGTGLNQLTFNDEDDSNPAFSADGTKIAFNSNRDGNNEIYVINADGTEQTRLTEGCDFQPSFSPDGTKIVFGKEISLDGEIYIMNSDGTNQTKLTDTPERNADPDFSPDGSQIIFVRGVNGLHERPHIYKMNLDGTGQTQLTKKGAKQTPAFSPDGTRIVFLEFGKKGGEIYAMNADGSKKQTKLTKDKASRDFQPNWGPAPPAP